MVAYIRSDLEFILKQIKIAEAHADGVPLYGAPNALIPTYNLAWGLRTVDGSYNHLLNPTLGAADHPFPELLDPSYRPAEGTPLDMNGPAPGGVVPTAPNYNPSNSPNNIVLDPSLRTISNLIVDQTLDNPAAIMIALERAGAEPLIGETNLLGLALQIKTEYQAVKPLFIEVEDTHRANVEAQRAFTAAQEAFQDNPIAGKSGPARSGPGRSRGHPGGFRCREPRPHECARTPGPAVGSQRRRAPGHQRHADQRRSRRGAFRPVQLLVHALRPVLRPRPRPGRQGRQRYRVHPAGAGRSALRSDQPDEFHGADPGHDLAWAGRHLRR